MFLKKGTLPMLAICVMGRGKIDAATPDMKMRNEVIDDPFSFLLTGRSAALELIGCCPNSSPAWSSTKQALSGQAAPVALPHFVVVKIKELRKLAFPRWCAPLLLSHFYWLLEQEKQSSLNLGGRHSVRSLILSSVSDTLYVFTLYRVKYTLKFYLEDCAI